VRNNIEIRTSESNVLDIYLKFIQRRKAMIKQKRRPLFVLIIYNTKTTTKKSNKNQERVHMEKGRKEQKSSELCSNRQVGYGHTPSVS
jgi:hypothetical protein